MSSFWLLVAVRLITVTGLNGNPIEINPSNIVSLRGNASGDHVNSNVKCIIHTTDGKYITVIEECDVVQSKIEAVENQ